MATAQLIDVSNQQTLLVESTQGRAGTPDGNIYFDYDNDRIELITVEDGLTQLDLGSGLEDNPLTNFDGITLQAIYAAEIRFRRTNTTLRNFKPGTKGNFKYAGAFAFINGVKLADGDRPKVRGSGMIEYAATGNGQTDIDRVYIGARSLNAIDPSSQPFYQLADSLSEADLQNSIPVNFGRTGGIDEMVQVFGTTANNDSGAGNFDKRNSVLVLKVWPFGRTFGSTNSALAGISELNAFSAGFGIGDSVNDDNTFSIADVYGGSAVSPWDTMTYEAFGSPQVRSGFTTADGSYDVIIDCTGATSLAQITAYLDALMNQDTDVDSGTGSYLPKRGTPLYTRDAQGRVVTKQGVHIDGVPATALQKIVQTDNAGDGKVYPFFPAVRVSVSDAWVNDANGWYRCMYTNGAGTQDFDNANAIIVDNAAGDDVEGTVADVLGSAGEYYLEFTYDYDSNSQAGLAPGVDKAVTFLVEGDGGATAAIAQFTITRTDVVPASAISSVENNL